MDRTTIDERDNETEDTNSSEAERRLSSDTLEADIEFVSSEEDLAATSTESGSEELLVREEQVRNIQGTTDILTNEAQQDTMVTVHTATSCLGTGRTAAEAQGMVVALFKKEDRSSLSSDYLPLA
jgi:hypothetical protein